MSEVSTVYDPCGHAFLTRHCYKWDFKPIYIYIYILLKSALKMQEMPFQRPKFKKISRTPTIVLSLWPPPH